jgi:hypothetical protein
MYELLEHRNVQKELAKVPVNVKEQYEELRGCFEMPHQFFYGSFWLRLH